MILPVDVERIIAAVFNKHKDRGFSFDDFAIETAKEIQQLIYSKHNGKGYLFADIKPYLNSQGKASCRYLITVDDRPVARNAFISTIRYPS